MVDVAKEIFPGPPGSVVEAATVIVVVAFGVRVMLVLPPFRATLETTGAGLG